jgi:hypothetical protein
VKENQELHSDMRFKGAYAVGFLAMIQYVGNDEANAYIFLWHSSELRYSNGRIMSWACSKQVNGGSENILLFTYQLPIKTYTPDHSI